MWKFKETATHRKFLALLTSLMSEILQMEIHLVEAGGSTDRETVVENLPATDFQGVTGKITFDEEGNCPKQQFFLEIKDGDYHEIPGVLLSQADWEAEKGFE